MTNAEAKAIIEANAVPIFPLQIVYQDWLTAIHMAEEALKNQATSEWIPTSERLPEEYTTVLISVEFGGVKFGYRTSLGEWVDESGGYRACYGAVLAWMPLPEAYKDGEQND